MGLGGHPFYVYLSAKGKKLSQAGNYKIRTLLLAIFPPMYKGFYLIFIFAVPNCTTNTGSSRRRGVKRCGIFNLFGMGKKRIAKTYGLV